MFCVCVCAHAIHNYAKTAAVNQVSSRSMTGTHGEHGSEGQLPYSSLEVKLGGGGGPAEAAAALAICAGLTACRAPLTTTWAVGGRVWGVRAGCPPSDSVAEGRVWLL